MSTIAKIDHTVRKARAQRSTIVRSYSRVGILARLDYRIQAIAAELVKVHKASHLTGEQKQEIFRKRIRRMSGEA